MKALFLSTDTSIPDIASATRLRMQGYADEIGELHVLMRSSRTKTTVDGSITIHEMRVAKIMAPFVLPRRARALIRTHDIEVVSAQDPFELGLAGLLAVSGTTAKLHIQVHTDFLSPWFTHGYSRQSFLNHIRTLIAAYVLPRAHGIRTVAPRVKRSMIARFGTRIAEPSVIPVLVADEDDAHATLTNPFAVTLIVVGRLEHEKRFSDAVKVLQELRKTHPDAGLVIAGDGRERGSLKHQVHTAGLEGWVRFLGNRPDVSQLMRAAHVLLQTSAYEGYNRTLIEAARAGLPIVTTDVGIVGDVFVANEHVLLAGVGDWMAFAEQTRRLIEDPELAQALAMRAQEAACAHLVAYEHQAAMIAHDLRDTLSRV